MCACMCVYIYIYIINQKQPPQQKQMARLAERRLSEFIVQDFANMAWALVTAGQSDVVLFTALVTGAKWWASDFNTHGLVNTAWAFAKAGRSERSSTLNGMNKQNLNISIEKDKSICVHVYI